MARAVVFKRVLGINCAMGREPSPVQALEPNVAFYTGVLGFTLARRDQQSAVLIQGARRATAKKSACVGCLRASVGPTSAPPQHELRF